MRGAARPGRHARQRSAAAQPAARCAPRRGWRWRGRRRRGLAAAQERARISEESLQRAQRQLRVNRVLVEAGDLARRELVQNEAEIANREIDLAEARNRVLEARLSLVDVLDLADPGPLELVPEETALEWEIPTFEEALQTALAGARAVRRAEFALAAATLALETARQQASWDLSLELGASRRIDRDDTDVSGSARLSIALGDRQSELQIARARAGLAAAERARAETGQQLEIAVRRALNAAQMSRQRVALAERALALARATLATERVKLNEGLSSSFRLTRVEQDLAQAERRLVGAATGYRDARLNLERTLGTLLDRWHVRIELIGG